jgi:predicted anti-sigma-YlaC factor YlaD
MSENMPAPLGGEANGQSAGAHLDEMTCMLYLERQLDRARAMEVSSHTQECSACRLLLRAIERESRLLTRAILEEEEPLPARLALYQQRVRHSLQWIWLVAVGLAATGVYALYMSYIEPWQRQLEQAGFGGSNMLGLLIFQGAFWKGWESMITLFEGLGFVTLAAFAAVLLRRRAQRSSIVALVLTGLCAALLLPGGASAVEFRKGESVSVPAEEHVVGDVFLSGARCTVEGTVDGDVYGFCRDLIVRGHVTGDVIAFAQSARVDGVVDGHVRAFSNNVNINGTVGEGVMSFVESINVNSSGKVGGSVTAFTSRLTVDGSVAHDVVFFGDHLLLNNSVGGAVRAKGHRVTISSTAEVAGPVRIETSEPPDVSPQAKLVVPYQYIKMEHKPAFAQRGYVLWRFIWAAAYILLGLVLFLLLPRFSQETMRDAEHLGGSLGLGILLLFGMPFAAVLCCITIVGLFIGVSGFLFWLFMLFCAQIVVGGLIGQWLMGRTTEVWPLIGRMAVGVAILRIATATPYAGHWIKLIALIWGLGAIAIALYRRIRPIVSGGFPSSPLPPAAPIGTAQPA